MELNRPLATITPTLDGDVLALLAQHEVSFTTGQLHRVLTRYSEEGIRKVLMRLTRQGIVRSERVGNAFSYQLNRDHLAAVPIIELAQLLSTLLSKLEKRFKSWGEYQPEYAAVFGSAARGTMTADSDLDILLVRADDTPLAAWEEQVHALAADVTRWTGNDTRLLEYTVSGLNVARSEPVLRDVLTEGLTVAGSHDWLNRQLRTEPLTWGAPGPAPRRSAEAACSSPADS
jgi:predicted nucleotidyltransferase